MNAEPYDEVEGYEDLKKVGMNPSINEHSTEKQINEGIYASREHITKEAATDDDTVTPVREKRESWPVSRDFLKQACCPAAVGRTNAVWPGRGIRSARGQ